MDATKIILTVITSLLVPLVSLLIWLIKTKVTNRKESKLALDKEKEKHKQDVKELEVRIEQQKELLNYMAGVCDMICQPSIKCDPEVREAMKKVLKRYHKLDLVKEYTKTEE